jgi:acyl-[acyl-carrier-protein]-phospholipid O-acyltransferase/long-chain-fatty-acid--[acyl-carrier-protein] ligase
LDFLLVPGPGFRLGRSPAFANRVEFAVVALLPSLGSFRCLGHFFRAGSSPSLLAALATGATLLIVLVVIAFLIVVLALRWPDRLIRLIFWLPAHLLYRMSVYGRENVPAKGPALFVCNHVSFIDAFLVFMAQKRPVRFVIWAPYTRLWGLRALLRWVRVIPIDGAAGPRAIVQSLRTASEVLKEGEVVCIFAEGGISRTGFLLPFHRGLEQILKRSPVPVIPVCLDHVWGSIFSYRGGRFFWKWPQRLPYPVGIAFGKPMPPTTTAIEVRQTIQKLSADVSIARSHLRMPVHRQFVRRASRHPLHPCIVDPLNKGKVYRAGEVAAGAHIMAQLLRPVLKDDQMVGIWLPPSLGAAFANIAVAFLGKVSVNLNYTLSPQVTRSVVEQCSLRRVLTSRLFTSKMPFDIPGIELVYLEDFRKQVTTWQRLRTFAAVLLLPHFVLDRWVFKLGKHRAEDLATVVFSSGSTGDPKGVMLTHGNLAANIESIIQAIDPRPSDRILGILPLFHSFGLTVTLWVPLQIGTSIVFQADPRQAKETGDYSRIYKCTILLTTPTFLRFNLKRCEPDDFKTMRIIMCGAEKLPGSLALEFKERFGVMPLEGYGCTELSPVAAANVPDWEDGESRQIANRPGTIGQPVPGVAARIVDPEMFEALPPGKEGLLLFYGANVMKGYLGRPDLTSEAIRDGWYITGDMGKFDEDGFIAITGRLARFSKIGGEMVPHQVIEDELQAIVGSNDRVFVVTAVPDAKRGERLIVFHTPLNGTSRRMLLDQLSARGLPNLWIPTERDFFELPELPSLGTGKVDLKRVKQLALEQVRN